jgi:hypothetical protein
MRNSGVSHRSAAQTGLEEYATSNVLDGTPLYIGKVRGDGVWVVAKFDSAAGSMLYANSSNNPSITDYTSAWAAHASLTYGSFETLNGV